jgi:hypothetical protein
MWFLSFDCGTKSLAYSIVCFNFDKLKQVGDIVKFKDNARYKDLDQMSKNIFEFEGNVIDLFPGINDKNISNLERVIKVSRFVHEIIIPKIKNIRHIKVLIEFQMGTNQHSRAVEFALISSLYEYDISIVMPSLKNKFSFSGFPETSYSYHIEKTNSTYTANKNHSKSCFLYLSDLFDFNISHIQKKRIPDLSDSFMQIFGYLSHQDLLKIT